LVIKFGKIEMSLNKPQKQIFILHPHFMKYGGASKVVLEFGSRLKKRGLDVKIVTTKINPAVIKNYTNLEFISLGKLDTGNLFFWILFPVFYFKLSELLKKQETKIIFAHSLAIYWGAVYKFFNQKIITVNYFHDLGMPYTDSVIEMKGLPAIPRIIASIALPFFRYINRKIINKTDYLISNSQTSANFIEKKYDRKTNLVAWPGVDTNIFKPSSAKEEYIYTLGRLEKIKNIDLVIKSFALYCKKYQNDELKLIIIGTGIEKKALIELAVILKIDKRITFTGNCDQKKVALIASHAKAGIFLCPNESFGLAAVESMACGTPVIGVNHGGIAETVSDGQTGLLSGLDENEIADKIHNLLTNKQKLEKLSEKARTHVEENYDWDKSTELLHQFFVKNIIKK
jgi:glycosyltransferase involved in cell wall biosynthesis